MVDYKIYKDEKRIKKLREHFGDTPLGLFGAGYFITYRHYNKENLKSFERDLFVILEDEHKSQNYFEITGCQRIKYYTKNVVAPSVLVAFIDTCKKEVEFMGVC